jgi:hypothetical protein
MKMRATQNFAYGTALSESWIHGGTVLDEDDPVVKAFPGLFEPVYETVSNPPEPAPVRRRRNG